MIACRRALEISRQQPSIANNRVVRSVMKSLLSIDNNVSEDVISRRSLLKIFIIHFREVHIFILIQPNRAYTIRVHMYVHRIHTVHMNGLL